MESGDFVFFSQFEKLCKQKGISAAKVAAECGFSKASITKWKQNNTAPKHEILIKIASYFGVTTDYLLGNEEKVDPDTALKFALFGGDGGITDEMLDEVKAFAEFVKNKYKKD